MRCEKLSACVFARRRAVVCLTDKLQTTCLNTRDAPFGSAPFGSVRLGRGNRRRVLMIEPTERPSRRPWAFCESVRFWCRGAARRDFRMDQLLRPGSPRSPAWQSRSVKVLAY
ncbi:enhancer of rudimentary-like protein [Anopheles sinensis]|uniref:Enhancer of rudimentary-like protein n=1 Tax=Anopheles sinensis TaxID=74873 RepID=A0A084VGJ0_ANOSI|nr:enhancer of rudimentary-like protein [Anopheles sinensis]